jgi:hypothetical protein
MDIEHTLAHGLVCIGLDKKTRLILHGSYPIMAYYNPIILDNNPIKHVQTRHSLYALELELANFGKRLKFCSIAKVLNYKRILDRRLLYLTKILSYLHHILSRHLRRTSTVRKYIQYQPPQINIHTCRKPILDKTSCWH